MSVTHNHAKVVSWLKKAARSAKIRGSSRTKYSEVYLDDCQFAEAAFKNGIGPRLHFASLDGHGQQAEDADDVWAESQARIASGEASQHGHNHASSSTGASGSGGSTNIVGSFGSANTVVPKVVTTKGSATSGKGKSGKRKPDHQSGPGFHYGKGKKGKH